MRWHDLRKAEKVFARDEQSGAFLARDDHLSS
jgi:hypothetical protein